MATFSLVATIAVAAVLLTPTNHAFSPPSIAFCSYPSTSAGYTEFNLRYHCQCGALPTTTFLQSSSASSSSSSSSPVSASAAPPSKPANEEVKIDGKPLINNTDTQTKLPFLQRLFTTPANDIIRGNRYGQTNNSTILTPCDAANKLGVKPTLEATKEQWQRAWKLHRFMMRMLHRFDGCEPKDSKLALACLWWKAIAGNDSTSPVYDYQLSYDLLPPVTRWIVSRRLRGLYPRLHHANVEIRTAYLDKSVANVINTIMEKHSSKNTSEKKKKIRLIVMGGGYDTRSMKLMERSLLQKKAAPHHNLLVKKRQSRTRQWLQMLRRKKQTPLFQLNAFDNITSAFDSCELECYELDLPEVVHAKRKLLQFRLFKRRPWLQELGEEYPKLVEVDFNNLNATQSILEEILVNDNAKEAECVENIILFEGVMIYLDEGIPHALLELCSTVLNKANNATIDGKKKKSGYLCFADRLENIPGGDEDAANAEMENTGWELIDWLPKPGLARHMGVARLNEGNQESK